MKYKIVCVLVIMVLTLLEGLSYGQKVFAEEDGEYIVLELSISAKDDAYSVIQEALNNNRDNSDTPIKVVVPAGSYKLSRHLVLYSNTYLECTDVTFTKNYSEGTVITIGKNSDEATGYSFYRNITIHGGVFDADGKSGEKTGSILKFAHAENVLVSGVTFKNCCNGHHIGFAGCKNVTISNCTFDGNYATGENKKDNREAIQLDILEKYHFPDLSDASYDGTTNKDITITGCTFQDVNRGVGSHSAYSGKYMDNVRITDNTFNNVSGYAIITSGYTNTTITNNKITKCGSGIYYRSIIPDYANYYKAEDNPKADKGSIIANNTIGIVDTKDSYFSQSPYGIRVYGENVTGSKKIEGGTLKAGDYRAQNVTIKNNDITIQRCANGIWLEGVVSNTVEKNTVQYTKGTGSKDECYGIRVVESNKVTAKNNAIKANNISYVKDGVVVKQSKNITVSSNKISQAAVNGIDITQSSQAKLTGNTVTANGQVGILCYDKSKITTSGNQIKNNKKHGIFLVNSNTGSSISKDKAEGSKQYGIALQNSSATIASARVKGSTSYGIYLTRKATAAISKCTSISNKKEGIYVTQNSSAKISGCTVSSNQGNGIYFTNKGKGSVQSTKLQKNKLYGIYVTKAAGSVTVKSVSYSGNKSGKIQK